MGDLTEKNAAGTTKVVGSDQNGNESSLVQSTNNGGLHANLRDAAGDEFGTAQNPIKTKQVGSVVSQVNSTTTPLLANASFTGNWEEVLDYADVSVTVNSDQPSSSLGVRVEWSTNGTDIDAFDDFKHDGINGDQWSVGVKARYFRLKYTNGDTDQTHFRVQTLLHYIYSKTSSHRINDSIDDHDDAELTKSVLTGRDSSGVYRNVSVDEEGKLVTSSQAELISPLPGLELGTVTVLGAGKSKYLTENITVKTAIKEFHIGGRQACEGTIGRYLPNNDEQVPGGGFNSSSDVSMWTFTGTGEALNGTPSYSTVQAQEGTGSLRIDHDDSDGNHTQEVTYTWSTPKDVSKWRYVHAWFYNDPEKIEDKIRTIQIRLTSGTAVRIYELSGPRNASPFGTVQWIHLEGEIENPSSTAGTGTFDATAVDSISLRMFDENNNTATLYWDDVEFHGEITKLSKIYTPGVTNQLAFDPIVQFETGEVLLLLIKNNSGSSSEFQISASGVDIS